MPAAAAAALLEKIQSDEIVVDPSHRSGQVLHLATRHVCSAARSVCRFGLANMARFIIGALEPPFPERET